MQIVHLSGVEVPARTAASIQSMNMCAAFAELGHAVKLVCTRGSIAASDFDFYGLAPSFTLERMPRMQAVLRAMRAHRHADLIYARDRMLALCASRSGPPLVFEAHVLPEGRKRSMERLLFASDRVIRLVVNSHALAEDYRTTFSRLPPIVVAPTAAKTESTAPIPALGAGYRVGYVGSDYRGRGLALVDALAERMPQVEFWVIGRDRIVSPHAAEGWCRAMDVLLLPYQTDVRSRGGIETVRWMSPLKMFEAMAAGRAIVASDLPVLREVLDESIAILVAPSDLAAWQEAIERLRDRSLRESLGRAARARFLERHTLRLRAEKVLQA